MKLGYNRDDLTPEQAEDVLAQSIPSGTLTPDVDSDAPGTDEDGDAGVPMAP